MLVTLKPYSCLKHCIRQLILCNTIVLKQFVYISVFKYLYITMGAKYVKIKGLYCEKILFKKLKLSHVFFKHSNGKQVSCPHPHRFIANWLICESGELNLY